jgi:catechol 2,3-dioxygenase-like lactoylglutathione lyase family enzyme
MPHRLTLTTVTIGAPDPAALARFYAQLLGWRIATEEPDWVTVPDPAGGVGLGFQTESTYVRPVWPGQSGDPQMQLHLDIRVDDLDAAGSHAVACGATLAEFQPQDDVRVYLDPVGHPFCLWVE